MNRADMSANMSPSHHALLPSNLAVYLGTIVLGGVLCLLASLNILRSLNFLSERELDLTGFQLNCSESV